MIRNAIQRFMYGRYGNDQLNLFLMGLYLLLYLVFMFTRWDMLYFVSFVLLALTLNPEGRFQTGDIAKVKSGRVSGLPEDEQTAHLLLKMYCE